MSSSIIKIRNLTKKYGKLTAVSNLDLDVPEGCVYGFLGPNGAGKTTVIKSVLGLTTPSSGEIEVFGKNIYTKRREIISRVGAVVESPALFPDFSAYENLRFLTRLSGEIPKRKIEETLDLVGLGNIGSQRVGTFSYGMKQRLGIAQALLPENRLIFLDEPTNGLDPHGILGVRKLIMRLRSELGITIFLSSHLLSEVEQVCDFVAIIDKGTKIKESKVSALIAEKELINITVSDSAGFAHYADSASLMVVRKEELAEGRISFLVKGTDDKIPELVKELTDAGIDIFGIVPHQRTLEDIFVELTGTDKGSSRSDRF